MENPSNFENTVSGGARVSGTLGQFSIDFKGTLTKVSKDSYSFEGTYQFRDGYDFDLRLIDSDGLRSSSGSNDVRMVRIYQLFSGEGNNFNITSEKKSYNISDATIKN